MLQRGKDFLKRQGRPEWRLEAELLVAHAAGLERLALFLALDRPVAEPEIQRARELLVRRAKGEPTAYLIGYREFYGLRMEVGPGVLIPRPESELLVDLARERLRGLLTPGRGQRVLDLCCGSGCLAVAIAKHVPAATVIACDLSPEALTYARRNAERHSPQVQYRLGDGFGALAADTPAFDVLVSNPPYVDARLRERPAEAGELALDPEVRAHEPHLALFAPPGHPDFWAQEVLRRLSRWVLPGGSALIELGADQAQRLEPDLQAAGAAYRFHKDLDGHVRVLELSVEAAE